MLTVRGDVCQGHVMSASCLVVPVYASMSAGGLQRRLYNSYLEVSYCRAELVVGEQGGHHCSAGGRSVLKYILFGMVQPF